MEKPLYRQIENRHTVTVQNIETTNTKSELGPDLVPNPPNRLI